MDANQLINCIECNKHDLTMRLRRIVLDPIAYMDIEGASTTDYKEEVWERHKIILELAKSIMNFYSSKWNDPSKNDEFQLNQLQNAINKLSQEMVPQIKFKIIEYYAFCLTNSFFFSQEKVGIKARQLMEESIRNVDVVCKELISLDSVYPSQIELDEECNLIEIVQEIMDDTNADVTYSYPPEWLDCFIKINKDRFKNHVLENIRSNVERHAFGTSEWRNRPLYERKLKIEFTKEEKYWVVKIYNNGTAFRGDLSRVYEYGYKFGEQQSSGKGMFSIRKTMGDLGGKILFNSSKNKEDEFSTSYEIKLHIK